MQLIDESKLRKLFRGCPSGDDVTFLHALLNHHLGPPDDQLPLVGSGALDFGPRTEAKVKKFQEANKIDIGTPFFKDGVVGPHTWNVLTQKQQVTVTVIAVPQLKLTPPTFPSLPGTIPPPPPPPAIPVPKLSLDSFQLQAGEQGTLPTQGKATAAHSFQLVGVLLNKNDKQRVHPEGQIGPSISFNRSADSGNSKTDLGFVAALVLNNLPGSGGRFSWSVQAQAALVKSLNNRSASGQGQIAGAANLSLWKRGEDDVLQVTTQLGGYLSAEAPNQNNGDKWKVTGGAVVFFGLTGTLALP